MSIAVNHELRPVEPSNFLIENRKQLSDLYFEAVSEKEILKEYLEANRYPSDRFLTEFVQLDNLVKAIARLIFP